MQGIKEEKVQEALLSAMLKEAKRFQTAGPIGIFGTTELTFWWEDKTFQRYIINVKGMTSISKKLESSIPSESCFFEYLVHIRVIL